MKAKPFSTVDEYGSSHEIDVARATCTRPLPTYCNRALTLRFSSLVFSEATVDGGRTLDEYRSSHWMIRTQCPRPTPIRGRDLFKEFLEGLDDDDEEDEETLFDSRSQISFGDLNARWFAGRLTGTRRFGSLCEPYQRASILFTCHCSSTNIRDSAHTTPSSHTSACKHGVVLQHKRRLILVGWELGWIWVFYEFWTIYNLGNCYLKEMTVFQLRNNKLISILLYDQLYLLPTK